MRTMARRLTSAREDEEIAATSVRACVARAFSAPFQFFSDRAPGNSTVEFYLVPRGTSTSRDQYLEVLSAGP